MAFMEETMTDKQFVTKITEDIKKVNRKIQRVKAKANVHIKNAQKAFDTVFLPPTKRRGTKR